MAKKIIDSQEFQRIRDRLLEKHGQDVVCGAITGMMHDRRVSAYFQAAAQDAPTPSPMLQLNRRSVLFSLFDLLADPAPVFSREEIDKSLCALVGKHEQLRVEKDVLLGAISAARDHAEMLNCGRYARLTLH